MKIALLTDSGANLDFTFVQKHSNLFILPLLINIDGISYKDQVEISSSEVYEKMDTHTIKSSLPMIHDFEAMVEKIKAEGYDSILMLNISSGLSGTYNALRLASQDIVGIQMVQYDTKTLAAGQGLLVEYALELIEQKVELSLIPNLLDKARQDDILAMYTINTLKYLKKGGRIGKVEGALADIIHIKPIISVNEEGVYVTLAKAFGLKRALIMMKNLLMEKFGKELLDLVIHFGNDLQKAKDLALSLMRDLNIRNLSITPLTPVLGIHTGPDMFAYVARRIQK